jgi:prevent-host-death family protein
MAIIRPVSQLQRKIGDLTKLAKETGEPIYLTKNGVEHLVLMDADAFSDLQRRADAHPAPAEGARRC